MKTYFKYLAAFVFLVALLPGCSKEHPQHYNDVSRISFWSYTYRLKTDTLKQNDSLTFSFIKLSETVVRDTVSVYVQIMGEPEGYDRPFSVTQINRSDEFAAVAGTHYVAFDDIKDKLYVPAGEVIAVLPVILLRDVSLETAEYRLEMEIVPNEYFARGIDTLQKFLVKTSDLLEKPSNWGDDGTTSGIRWGAYFGDWSRTKMRFLISYVVGDIEWEEVVVGPSLGNYYRSLAREKLEEYNAAHPDDPLSDENGPITF